MSTTSNQGKSHSERWYFTKDQLENTPSRRCGYDAEKELSCRQQAANLIQDMGQRLQVTQLCINTAIVYMHRFYVFHSFTQFHRNSIATASLFLAAKVEEQPRKLEHVIRVAQICLMKGHPALDPRSEAYQEQAQEIVVNENVLLQTLGFDVGIEHPHTFVVKCCHLVRAPKDLAQTSYFMASNTLHLTTMCLQYRSTVVACFCIHLACKWANWEIPQSTEGKKWYWYIDKEVTQEQLEQLTEEFLAIFDKCPSKLKKRICSISSNQNSTMMAAFDGDNKRMSLAGSSATFAPPMSTSGRIADDKRRDHNGPPPEYRKLIGNSRDTMGRIITSTSTGQSSNKPIYPFPASSSRPPHHTPHGMPKIKPDTPVAIVKPDPHHLTKQLPTKDPLSIKQEPLSMKPIPYQQEPPTQMISHPQPQPLLPIRKHEPTNPSRMANNKSQSKPVIPHDVRRNGHDHNIPMFKPSAIPAPTMSTIVKPPLVAPPSHSDLITNVIKEVSFSKQNEKSLLHQRNSIPPTSSFTSMSSLFTNPHLSQQNSIQPQHTKAPSIFSPEKITSPIVMNKTTPFKTQQTPTPPPFSPIKISPSKNSSTLLDNGMKIKSEYHHQTELVPVVTKVGDDFLSKPRILASEIINEVIKEPNHISHDSLVINSNNNSTNTSSHPKKKKKHKEKDKDKKHKKKDKHKDDRHHKEKRKDKNRDKERSKEKEKIHLDPEPIRITIPKEKIMDIPTSKPIKIRIRKEKMLNNSKDSSSSSNKRERNDSSDDCDYPSSKRLAS